MERCGSDSIIQQNDHLVCDNYHGISLLSIPGKILANVLLGWLRPVIEPSLLEQQCGFRPQRETIDQIWVLRQVIEKAVEHRSNLHICFVDLSKAFDSVPRHALTNILKYSGIEDKGLD